MPRIAVIIPCLNEAEFLPATLRSLQTSFDASQQTAQLIVVDGGSGDETIALASDAGCEVLKSGKQQRSHQLNLGARAIAPDVEMLWFVHADTQVPMAAATRLGMVTDEKSVLGGAFCRRFDSNSSYLRWTSLVTDLRGRLWKYFYGDQAMFIRRSAFEQLGGFDESLAVAEDLDLSLRLRELGKVTLLSPAVLSSARRFEKLGPHAQVRKDRDYVKAWMAERGWRDWRRGKKTR